MPHLIGTDEAGYGPNLGPLVVSATLWKVPDLTVDMYAELAPAVKQPAQLDGDRRIEFGDSKNLYQPHGSLARLERGVLSALASIGDLPTNLSELVDRLTESDVDHVSRPWFAGDQLAVPHSIDHLAIAESTASLKACFKKSASHILSLTSAVLFPDQFNQGVAAHQNKATLLSATTLNLVRKMIEQVDGDVSVTCDRHGGRSRYAGLLQQFVTDSYVRVIDESPECSRYQWTESGRRVEVQFITKGERELAVGLASMVSKYVRELCMLAWNRFWQHYVPGLKPTAGYPVDARRFKSDILKTQKQLKIADDSIWRCR